GRASGRSLRSTYYDTADHTLAKAGISVRLRTGAGGVLQTVKDSGQRASGLFARREWETRVSGPDLDTAQLTATGINLLADPAVVAALSPIFSTEVRRTAYQLAGPDWQVEMALDVGDVVAGERHEPIREIELELRQGDPSQLFALARRLAESLPVNLLALSKSDRGYGLARGRGPSAVKAKPVELEPKTTLGEGFQTIARNCLHHLLANEGSLLTHGDAEAVHQMRVALRRLRSALKVFRPLVDSPELAGIKAEIRWLLGRLGPARDAEVFVAEILDPVVEAHPGVDGLVALRDHFIAERDRDLAAARQGVAERRFTIMLLDLGAWVEAGTWTSHPMAREPIAPFARHVLKRLARKLRKAGGKSLHRLAPPDLHEVRIRGKQLRYAGEFFAPLWAKQKSKEYLAALSTLQDLLGEMNDIAVAGPRLAACHHLPGLAWAAGLVTGWHDARRPALMESADDLWAEFRKRKGFW
ncbi:MAG TPA: CHAD domain-containing protein, partial [Magnetospirillum sp.]|nr:CHAD domain-containing protein [Magnetospirillum sp.]